MIDIGTKLTSERTERYGVGEYELRERLGGGRIAQVFLAEQTWPAEKEGHQVAIKLAANFSQNDRLESERKVLEAVAGKQGFPRLEGYGVTREKEGRVFLVMELVPRDSELARIARGRPGHRLDERLGIEAALQYARMLEALHAAGYASTDRKLDDIIWDDKTNLDGPRLVVLDWNVTAVDREVGRRRDLYQFGLFWHELLLGTPPTLDQDRAVVGLEGHPHWPDLTYGTQRILGRALSRVTARRYQQAEDLVQDLEALTPLFDLDAEDLIARAKAAGDPTSALAALDVLEVRFPEVWPDVHDLAEKVRLDALDRHKKLLNLALSELQQALYSKARVRLEQVLQEVSEDPERALHAERWLCLARFGGSLEAEVEGVFRKQALPALAGAEKAPGLIEDLENGRFRQAADRFWGLLTDAFLGPGGRGRVPPAFLENLEEAQRRHGEGYSPKPWFQEAHIHLREPWPDQAALFAAVVGLGSTERQGPLLFLVDEALVQEKLREMQEVRRVGDLRWAADLYGQARRLFEAIPYAEWLLQAGLENPAEGQRLCERLADTLGEAERCLKAGQTLLEARLPEFKRAQAEFERGLALFPGNVARQKWGQERGVGKVAALRAGRARAQRCLDLQAVLDTDDLEATLMRCEALLNEFPEDPWGQEQRERLRKRLTDQVERTLGTRLLPADQAMLEAGDALSAARLVALARRYFPDDTEIRKRLPGWELRATLTLQGELNALVARVEGRLRHGWQAGLDQMLDDWMAGHTRLRQAAHFTDVFEHEALVAQEEKLDGLYNQVKYLAQLQRDIATQLGERRAAVDELEQQRREARRQAETLWQEARTLYAEIERSDRRQAALERAQQTLDLWPERIDVRDFAEKVKREIADINRRLGEVLREAREALAASEYERALAVLAEKAPPDADLLPEQQEAPQSLHASIEQLHGLSKNLAVIRWQGAPLERLLVGETANLPQALEQLRQVADLIEGAPEELPQKLKMAFQGYVEQAESLLWEARSRLGARQTSLRAHVAGALALVGLAKERLAAKVDLAPEYREEEVV